MSKSKKRGLLGLTVLLVIAAAAWFFYKKYFGNIQLNRNYTFIYIENGDDLEDVMDELSDQGLIQEDRAFHWLAGKMDLEANIHPGKYRVINGMNLRQIINLIKYHKEEKIRLTYNSQIRNLDDFVSYTAERLEMNESEIEEYLSDEKKLQENFGLDPDNAFALIVPGVYEVSWAISTEELFEILKKRFKAVWNESRIEKSLKTGLPVSDIITLASIVQSESPIQSEQEKIAGVYMNRLKIGMPLQADPTLRFATKKFDAQRFYNADKEVNSPYNTYRHKGLPPGPVCLVSTQAIDATLNYAKHKYLYFCARCELNGYSDFSVTYEQHKKFAEAYHREMEKRGIK